MESEESDYLTVPQVTRILHLKNAYTVRRWIKAGVLEAEKVIEGKRHRYRIKRNVVDIIQGKITE
jgi:excisionase family DNA binding protein